MPEPDLPTLAASASPFLRHGATQPVNWLPWSEGAFERARRESRPILLDIGAVWCHWCHVMDQESYEDAETARLINDLFVPIKVDRDERPDIDARYQRAVQALTGQGGWPLTAFLTPDGDVYYAGTYFPPEDSFGRPAFRRVLTEVARVWREERERALEAVHSLRTHLSALEQQESDAGELSPDVVERGVEAFAEVYDFRHGGFGRAPKFPNAGALLLLLDRALDSGEGRLRHMVGETLGAMGRGGIYDQLGGGFHRYSVDARWVIPHFEKMAYDNGPLLAAYARAAAVLGDPFLRQVAEGIAGYYRDIVPELVDAGGFPASQDADVGVGDDGGYWTWTEEEVRTALAGDERLVTAAVHRYGLSDLASGMHTAHDRHVLYLAEDVTAIAARLGVDEPAAEQLLAEVAGRLKRARDQRARPFVDETVYSGWAALVASGHLAAARYLGLQEAGAAALRALERIWAEAFDVEDGVAHRVGDGESGGYLEDQALVAEMLLDAYEWTQRPEYLERARQLVEIMLRRYLDPASGAFGDRPHGEPAPVRALAEPHLPIVDSPTPSGNAVAALVLLRLEALLGEPRYRERALAVLRAFAATAQQMPTAVATYLRAVDWATAPVTTVAVVGTAGDEAASALLAAALSTYRPRTVVRRLEPEAVPAEALPPPLRAMVSGEAPRAYLCAGQSCAAPVSRAEELVDLMRTFRG